MENKKNGREGIRQENRRTNCNYRQKLGRKNEGDVPTRFRREVWTHALSYLLPLERSFVINNAQKQLALGGGSPGARHDEEGRR